MRNYLRKWLGITGLDLQLESASKYAEVAAASILGLEGKVETLQNRVWALGAQVDALSNVTKALALPAPGGSVSKQDEDVADDSLPMEVEAAVGRWWFDQPQAAQATRTYARGLLGKGMHPEQIARRIAENGVVIE